MLNAGCSLTLFCLQTLAREVLQLSTAKLWVFIQLGKMDTCVLSLCCAEKPTTKERHREIYGSQMSHKSRPLDEKPPL